MLIILLILRSFGLTTQALLQIFGEAGLFYATILLTLVIIVFGEILPKSLAIKLPEKIIVKLAFLIVILFKIFSPFVVVTQKISSFFINLFSASDEKISSEFEDIRDSVNLKMQEGVIVKYDKDLIDGVLDLSDTEISEIMVHRKDIASIDVNLPISKIIKDAIDIGHTRIPLWKNNSENIVAILNVRKLLSELYFYDGNLNKFNLKSNFKSLVCPNN